MSSKFSSQPNYTPTPLSANADAVVTGPGIIHGIFVSTATTATIAVRDSLVNGSGGTVIIAAFPVVAGTFYPLDAFFALGCSITITGTCAYTALTAKANLA